MKSTKVDERPSFQFFPGDWLREPGLRLCDLAARGLWADLLSHMWTMPDRGVLAVNGEALTKQEISNLVGRPVEEVESALLQLVRYKVCGITEAGAICSRRQIRDERIRQAKVRAGRKGGLANAGSKR